MAWLAKRRGLSLINAAVCGCMRSFVLTTTCHPLLSRDAGAAAHRVMPPLDAQPGPASRRVTLCEKGKRPPPDRLPYGTTGRNWQRRFTTAWLKSLRVYRLTGTVRYGTAHAWR